MAKKECSDVEAVIGGLTILNRYPSANVCTGHDQLLAGHTPPAALTEEERVEMKRLGWRWEDREESWAVWL